MSDDLRLLLENMLDGTHLFLQSDLYWGLDNGGCTPDHDTVREAVTKGYIYEDGGDFRYAISREGELALRGDHD